MLNIKNLDQKPMMNALRPIHPGEILREEFLIPMHMSASALALAVRVPAPRINDVVRERRGVSADTALRLGRYLGTTPDFWMGLQTDYDLKTTEPAVQLLLDQIHPYQMADA